MEGDTLTVDAVSNVTGGSVDLAAGVVTFTPDPNLCGNGAGGFDYTVGDGNGGSDGAHVTVDITCVNDAPVATDDAATGTEDTDVAIAGGDLTGNDTDTEGDALTVTDVSNAVGGSAHVAAGDVTFTPDENLCGTGAGSFDYTIDDGNDGTDTGHVVIDLTCVNDNPSAGTDTVTVAEDFGRQRRHRGHPRQRHRRRRRHGPRQRRLERHGRSVDLAAGVVTFTPTADGCGNGYGSFDYQTSDGNGGTANGHAEVNVTCVDDAPVATDDAKTGTEDTDVVLTGAFLTGNDTDIDTDQGDLTSRPSPTWSAARPPSTTATSRSPDRQPVRRRRGQLRLHGRRRQRRDRHRPRGDRPHVRQRCPDGRRRQRHGRRELGGGGLRRARQRHGRGRRHAHAGVRRHGHPASRRPARPRSTGTRSSSRRP